jgi:hypothetical protein
MQKAQALSISIEAVESAISSYESKKLNGQAKIIVLNKLISLKSHRANLMTELCNELGISYEAAH